MYKNIKSLLKIFYLFFSVILSISLLSGEVPVTNIRKIDVSQDKKKFSISQRRGQHRFRDAEKWAERFENPERDKWQKPDSIIKALNLHGNEIIVDIGSATGYFPVRFARTVPDGQVYGIDIEENMVTYLNNRAKREGLSNLLSIVGEPDDPKIPEPADIIFICNTYHHIEDRVNYFTRLKKDFKKNGRLIIVDFVKGDTPHGPPDYMKLSESEVISELTKAGYRLIQTSDILPYQYFLIFQLIE